MGRTRDTLLLLSPVLVIGLSTVAAVVSCEHAGAMAWAPPMPIYWALMALYILALTRKAERRWFRPSTPSAWRFLTLLTCVMAIAPVLATAKSYEAPHLGAAALWLTVVLINPLVEECYWRGALIDAGARLGWPAWWRGLFSALCFGVSHPAIIGVNVALVAGWTGFVGAAVFGLIWAIGYLATQSLRWSWATHLISDMASIAIIVGIVRIF
jgi:membrane protease YdiL (CAAX protease family)